MEACTGENFPLSATSSSLYFTQIEVNSLKEFLHTVTTEQLRQLLKIFKTRCLISEELYIRLDQIHRQSGDMDEMFTLLITHLSRRCTSGLPYVLFVMYHSGYQNLAYTLYTINQNILEMLKRKPPLVQRLDTLNRKKIQIYFESLKKNLQDMIFRDPVGYFMRLSIKVRQKIYTTVYSSEEAILQEFCDKYVVTLALTIDALSNKTNQIDPNHELFRDMESIISFTSCPDLSRCMLYGRRAVALSFVNKREGEGLLREGLICSQRVSSCLEIVDLHYKSVLFLRTSFENFPQIMLNRIYEHMQSALQILENEPDDVRRFWTQRFIFRLLCCILGLGMRCRFIEKFNCPFYILQEAERLLSKYDSPDAECRLQMYFSIAKSRLQNLKGDNNTALEYISQAKEIARKGNFSELKNILAAEQVLLLPNVAPLFVETENNNDFTDIIVTEPIHLPPSYHLPSSSKVSNHILTLTFRSNSEVPISVQSSIKEEEIGNEAYMPSDESIPNEEAAISHDFSREVVHLRSAKINRETI
ncbi:uncharacterized protein LOC130050293 [Ostrea edulis]|uniref:uncharacterized protein LOC130050293 n=1 Tax=Ostrea edulis TaxID=37623 RepID=UPI0024AEC6DA|nr:uncharacterized protein LOC130050293 [Ostrea edulis]